MYIHTYTCIYTYVCMCVCVYTYIYIYENVIHRFILVPMLTAKQSYITANKSYITDLAYIWGP